MENMTARRNIGDFAFGILIGFLVDVLFLWSAAGKGLQYLLPVMIFVIVLIVLVSALIYFRRKFMAIGIVLSTVIPLLLFGILMGSCFMLRWR